MDRERDGGSWGRRARADVGAQGTFYAGHTYAISLSFPPTYPYAAPTVRFESTCYRALPSPSSPRAGADACCRPERRSSRKHLPGYVLQSGIGKSRWELMRWTRADILKEQWSPMLSVSTILVSIQSLLGGRLPA